MAKKTDEARDHYDWLITVEQAGTLGGAFRERVRRTPDKPAYRYYDGKTGKWHDNTWRELAHYVARWQSALLAEGLQAGDRVAIMLRNSPDWIAVDQAALGLGLVVVPLYVDDNAGNMAYTLEHSGARLLVLRDVSAWEPLSHHLDRLKALDRVISLEPIMEETDPRLAALDQWLPDRADKLCARDKDPHALATIIYTSGTTGRPKGVMLSHHSLLWNAWACWEATRVYPDDIGLSFLPLAHAFERTSSYYLSVLVGAFGVFNRSIEDLPEDLQLARPTALVSVPRIYERVYAVVQEQLAEKPAFARALFNKTVDVGYSRFERRQGRGRWRPSHMLWPLLHALVARKVQARFGGRLRFAVSGGAALAPQVSRMFIGLGIEVLQGYGLTEAAPVVSTNRLEDNDPASVGTRLEGVQVKMQQNGELLVKSPGVMMGYWNDPEATAKAIDELGWLHTGDKVRRLERNRIYLTGRFKEIVVMANGEKSSPVDMEQAITIDPVIDQAMAVGEARPYMAALVVLDAERRDGYLRSLGLDPADPESLSSETLKADLLQRIAGRLGDFPHYAQIRQVAAVTEPWTVDNGMLTPTMKLKRRRILEQYKDLIEQLYEGHAHVEQTEISRNVRVAG